MKKEKTSRFIQSTQAVFLISLVQINLVYAYKSLIITNQGGPSDGKQKMYLKTASGFNGRSL